MSADPAPTPTPGPGPNRPSRLPLVLLALMTAACFGGPFLIALVLRGGRHSYWPPDRPVEWWTFGGITGLVVLLIVGGIALGVANQRALTRARADRSADEGP